MSANGITVLLRYSNKMQLTKANKVNSHSTNSLMSRAITSIRLHRF